MRNWKIRFTLWWDHSTFSWIFCPIISCYGQRVFFFFKNPKEENEAIRFFVFKHFDKVVNLTKNEGSKGQHDD